jgi:MerR family transcriptional regulator, thiopeptide resistance regulator
VSLRTLRFYDQEGLLSPSGHTEAGYRLYTDDDLATLQQIVALKYLGLSLDEVRECLNRRPERLKDTLARQRLLMVEKCRHLRGVIRAIDAAEASLGTGTFEWDSLTRVIEAMQMEQNKEWVKNYFTDDQLNTMGELGRQSYSEQAAQKLAARPVWTEEDQQRASAQWQHIADESSRLAAAGADPAGKEGQALAKLQSELLVAFTQGDPEIAAGVARFWESHSALPPNEQPLASWSVHSSGPAGEFMEKAMVVYQKRASG